MAPELSSILELQPELSGIVLVYLCGIKLSMVKFRYTVLYKNGSVEALGWRWLRYGFGMVKVRVRIWVRVLPMRFHDLVKIRYWFGSHNLDFLSFFFLFV